MEMSNMIEPVHILTENGQSSTATSREQYSSEDDSLENQDDAVSLVTAINRKYCSEQCSVPPCGSAIFMKATDHLPGKRRASGSLELLVLNEQSITVAGDLNQLSPLVRNITELDLAFNKLSNWREVLTVLSQMPHLVHANLSHNPLKEPLSKDDDWFESSITTESGAVLMRKMNSLVLNSTGILWQSLFTLLDIMPNLEELHLSLNDYSALLDTEKENGIFNSTNSFPHIHNLHLNHCKLRSWRALLMFCRLFPCLETLIAAGNGIDTIGQDGQVDTELAEYFGCLHTLNINYWPLTSWDDVDELRKFPLLSELRINHVPLLQTYDDSERRHLLIARLPDITMLNGSSVSSEQRENAERFFLRYYLDNENKPERYLELESIHGRLMPLADIDLSPKDCADVVLVMDDRREPRRISLNQTVAGLKKSLQTFCHMPPGRFNVFHHRALFDDPCHPCYLEELRLPNRMLHSLNIDDNDEFHIHAKPDPPARRRTSSSNSAPCSANSPSKLNSGSTTSPFQQSLTKR